MAGVPQLDDRVARVVFEALESVATMDVAADIVADALGQAQLGGPPASPAVLRKFVAEELWPAVVARLGPEAADVVAERLTRVAESWELSDSHVRRKRRGTADYSDRPGAAPGGPTAVLLVSSDPGLADELRELGGTALAITEIADSIELLRRLEDVEGQRSVLVVDCLTSPIAIETLVTSAPYLPEESPVLLWRAPDHVTLSGIPRSRALRWSLLRQPCGIAELVATLGHIAGY